MGSGSNPSPVVFGLTQPSEPQPCQHGRRVERDDPAAEFGGRAAARCRLANRLPLLGESIRPLLTLLARFVIKVTRPESDERRHEFSRADLPFRAARPVPAPLRRSRRPWVEHWLDTCSELQALKASHPMMDAVIDEVDGRMIRIGDHWLADFASCNYLGFDLDREIIDAIPAYLDKWGTHPSWSRLLGSPVLYEEIETRLTELLGSEDSLVLPTITHIHMSVIPLLAASGTIFLDARAHKTIYDGCQVGRARGAAVKRFRFEDPDHLDQLLGAERDPTRLVCMDGVNSMTGNAPDLRAFAAVAATTARCSTSTTPTASA